ncbi:hypothetical protein K461DRAFT_274054 [Myriangium duriaei CBS 260.36]|uniref:Uncharacterized protein n=1 Tax=Myriangium duriaei CBS 260.36 TaxID=1168546 RepID=A0A9P4JA72_9PEZI|nr:hypothetical protein K461DRAFT_274054 [Myriangium duriaei CBS 260.36]
MSFSVQCYKSASTMTDWALWGGQDGFAQHSRNWSHFAFAFDLAAIDGEDIPGSQVLEKPSEHGEIEQLGNLVESFINLSTLLHVPSPAAVLPMTFIRCFSAGILVQVSFS